MSVFSKEIIQHVEFYLAKFIKNPDTPYLIFIHGGPGLNSAVLEYFIDYR